ncbi:MAG: hypothetical protein HYU64_18370, partial [Armatimonadetes bacterium]|nr:hypothetical protein [Armatimonadota bacterium]
MTLNFEPPDLEQARNRPVECLGITFENDEERRACFLEKLRANLRDPEFREMEGFPIGSDEDILALSDPPYYTACPNPFIADFIKHYGKPYDPNEPYRRQPFAVDVSEGKTDPIYKAHSYHTKVPHLAIVPCILHYTEPGDVVLDGFCGSGMTGVAAQWCGTAPESYRRTLEALWEKEGIGKPRWGARRVVLNDLSPAATFSAANYNIPFDVREFTRAGKQILDEVEQEIGWMYDTLHGGAGILPAKKILEKAGWKPAPLTEFKQTQRDLPHWQYPGAIFFVTFRTYQGILLSTESRSVVLNALKYWHGSKIHLFSAVVMPDHVHMLFQLSTDKHGHVEQASSLHSEDLSKIMHSIKSYSANQINKVQNRSGILWQTERH